MEDGRRTPETRAPLEEIRERAGREIDRLPARIRELEPAAPPYPVRLTTALRRHADEVRERVARRQEASAGDG